MNELVDKRSSVDSVASFKTSRSERDSAQFSPAPVRAAIAEFTATAWEDHDNEGYECYEDAYANYFLLPELERMDHFPDPDSDLPQIHVSEH